MNRNAEANQSHEAADRLADFAVRQAGQGFAAKFKVLGLDKNTVDLDAAGDILRRNVKAVLNEALDDASEAMACGMNLIASETLAVSFRLAGIRAAEELAGLAV